MRILSSVYRNLSPCKGHSFANNLSLTLGFVWLLAACIPVSALPATTVTLAITSGGSAVTTVSSGSVITLTATVMAGTTPVTPGQVDFCDAAAAHCLDIHLLATAQLTSAGKATYKFRPGGGSHSYKVIFKGTTSYASSTSTTAALTVTGPFPTVTSLSPIANSSGWTLTATVSGGLSTAGIAAPTGTVSFLNTSNSNAVLATAPLVPSVKGLSFATPLGPPAFGSISADFNQDGIPDLAESGSNLFLGNGDGAFSLAASGIGNASGLAVGDFNADDIPDVALSSPIFTYEFVLLSAGDGSFSGGGEAGGWLCPDDTQFLGCGAQFVTTGDFNGDGNEDMIVTGGYPYTYPPYLSVLLGNGDGTFTGPYSIVVATLGMSGARFVAVGDFNRDGALDLAVLPDGFDEVSILLGNGDGSFTRQSLVPLPTGSNAYTMALGDFNGDGALDLAVPNGGSDTVTILLGKGDGTFAAAPESPTTGYNPTLITLGDFNGDDIADLAVSNQDGGNLSILLGKGDGTFVLSDRSSTSNVVSCCSLAGDFNGDGLSDVASGYGVLLTQSGWTATATADVSVAGLGTPLVEASFLGDTNYKPSVSSTTTLVVQDPTLIDPLPGYQLPGSTATFEWSAGTGATQYRLYLATNWVGGSNLYASGNTTTTEATVSGLPTSGVTVYARLWFQIANVWQYKDYTYTAYGTLALAEMTAPTAGSVLGTSATFTWSPGTAVTAYLFDLGSTGPSSSNLYNSGSTTATSASVSGMPANGVILYATLYSKINGAWQIQHYTYTESGTPMAAVLTTPIPGSVFAGSSATFTWTPGSGPTAYYLELGTFGSDSSNLYNSGLMTATSVTASGLPMIGAKVYATLHSEIDGVWQATTSTYTEGGSIVPAMLRSPAPGGVLGPSAVFSWTTGSEATDYIFDLGTTASGSNLYSSGTTTAQSASVSGIPEFGMTVYATLYSKIGGGWRTEHYTYKESGTP